MKNSAFVIYVSDKAQGCGSTPVRIDGSNKIFYVRAEGMYKDNEEALDAASPLQGESVSNSHNLKELRRQRKHAEQNK